MKFVPHACETFCQSLPKTLYKRAEFTDLPQTWIWNSWSWVKFYAFARLALNISSTVDSHRNEYVHFCANTSLPPKIHSNSRGAVWMHSYNLWLVKEYPKLVRSRLTPSFREHAGTFKITHSSDRLRHLSLSLSVLHAWTHFILTKVPSFIAHPTHDLIVPSTQIYPLSFSALIHKLYP